MSEQATARDPEIARLERELRRWKARASRAESELIAIAARPLPAAPPSRARALFGAALRPRVVAASLFAGLVGSAVWAVAIPNVCRMGREVDREARINLAGLFTAEKAFNGEYGTYGTDLVSINWRPEGKVGWAFGFCNEHPTPGVSGIRDWIPSRSTTADTGMRALGGFSPDPSTVPLDPCTTLAALGLAQIFRADGAHFTAFAIRYAPSGEVEVWAIDQDKHSERLR